MRGIVAIFAIFSLVTANVTRDLHKIKFPRKGTASGLPQPTSSADTRIVGGNEAARNSLPYQVFLMLIYRNGYSSCGGSLITRRYVLTAAHCLDNGLQSVEVVLGAHNVRQTESTQQRIQTTTFRIHEQYDRDQVLNDIGYVYLPTLPTLNQYVQVITLPRRSDASNTFVGSLAIVSGWGYDSDYANDISNVLRSVEVPIISNEECRRTFSIYIRDSTICSGGTGGRGVCFGDSGGPIAVNGLLVGVASFTGYNGCEGGEPSGFVRVTSYLDWIAANTDAIIS